MRYQTKKSVASNQQGFASLVIGLVLVLVLALLTVGFAQLTRHEQQQSLGNALSTQAYYASESGINDAVKAIKSGTLTTSTPNVNTNNCLTLPLPGTTSNVINTTDAVSYSCVLLSLQTGDLQFGNVGVEGAETMVFNTTAPLSTLTVDWGSADAHVNFNTPFPSFKPVNSWTAFPGLLQFSITPLTNPTRANLLNNSFMAYAYPKSGVGPNQVNYSTAANAQGAIVSGQCAATNTPYACKMTIRNLPGAGGPYLIHFLNFYDASNVDITGTTAAGAATFVGGQAQIDVTGKAQDVLKRLRVRVPLDSNTNFANYALEAQNVCKRLQTQPGATTFLNPDGSTATTGACALSN
jgi:hypothetical protein